MFFEPVERQAFCPSLAKRYVAPPSGRSCPGRSAREQRSRRTRRPRQTRWSASRPAETAPKNRAKDRLAIGAHHSVVREKSVEERRQERQDLTSGARIPDGKEAEPLSLLRLQKTAPGASAAAVGSLGIALHPHHEVWPVSS